MPAESLTLDLKLPEALFLLLSAKLNQEFLESIQLEQEAFGEKEMGALIQKLESRVGQSYAQLTDEILAELINSFLPELPIRNVGMADYSFPMYNIDETLPKVQEAVEKQRALKVEYYSMDREEVNVREVEPYFLEKRYNYYILMAYCRWREDIRLFRVDRIKSLVILEEHFDKPDDFQAEAYSDDDHI